MSEGCSLFGLAYAVGETRVASESLPELQADSELCQLLLEFGVREYRTSVRDCLELGAAAAKASLDRAGWAPESLDTVLVASSTFPHDPEHHGRPIARFLERIGAHRAYPLGVTSSFCGNAQSALRIARALLLAGDAERVLVVCTDTAGGASRIVPPGISVASDGAAACVLARAPGGLRLIDTVQTCLPELQRIDLQAQAMEYMKGVAEGLRAAVERLLERNALSVSDLRAVVLNNYNTWATTSMGRAFGCRREQLFLDNIQRYGHVNSADNLINLTDLLASDRLSPDDTVLMVGTGPCMWGASLLRMARSEGDNHG